MSNEALLAQRREMRQEIEQLTRERDAALADLRQARAERDEARLSRDLNRQEFEDAHGTAVQLRSELETAQQLYNEAIAALAAVENDRDAAIARAEAAEAEAIAKHNALVHAYEVLRSSTVRPAGHSGDEESSQCDEDCAKCAVEGAIAHADEAFEDYAGRALLERHAAELKERDDALDGARKALQASVDEFNTERAARNRLESDANIALDRAEREFDAERTAHAATKAELESAREEIARLDTECKRLAEDIDDVSRQRNRRADGERMLQAKLEGAVAALREIHARAGGTTTRYDRDAESALSAITETARAILADPTAQAAADSYRAQQEERAELEAVYEAAKHQREKCGELFAACAKVYARRGGGEGGR